VATYGVTSGPHQVHHSHTEATPHQFLRALHPSVNQPCLSLVPLIYLVSPGAFRAKFDGYVQEYLCHRRKRLFLGPYSRPESRALCNSYGGVVFFLMRKVPLYRTANMLTCAVPLDWVLGPVATTLVPKRGRA
jgi:hypothetical protein